MNLGAGGGRLQKSLERSSCGPCKYDQFRQSLPQNHHQNRQQDHRQNHPQDHQNNQHQPSVSWEWSWVWFWWSWGRVWSLIIRTLESSFKAPLKELCVLNPTSPDQAPFYTASPAIERDTKDARGSQAKNNIRKQTQSKENPRSPGTLGPDSAILSWCSYCRQAPY